MGEEKYKRGTIKQGSEVPRLKEMSPKGVKRLVRRGKCRTEVQILCLTNKSGGMGQDLREGAPEKGEGQNKEKKQREPEKSLVPVGRT